MRLNINALANFIVTLRVLARTEADYQRHRFRRGARRCMSRALICLVLCLPGVKAVAAELIVIPESPVEGGLLRVRFVGPFGQPAPSLNLRVDGARIVAQTSYLDYVDPQLPTVAFVEAAIGSPAAGNYQFVHESCAGNPPPPVPNCSIVSSRGLVVSAAVEIPSANTATRLLLLLLLGSAAATTLRLRPSEAKAQPRSGRPSEAKA